MTSHSHPKVPGIRLKTDKKAAQALVWAPFAESVSVHKQEGPDFPLRKSAFGYWEHNQLPLKPGNLYQIKLDNKPLPDPASLAQPNGVHGPSQIADVDNYLWKDHGWKGYQVKDLIIYEVHTGTFSPSGDFRGIADRLDHLKKLGINAIELMPVAQFPGQRNWGYDGVFPYAVHPGYGGIRELQKLVDTCHENGIAVILDVVYNHLGPEGNYLNEFGPYFTDKYRTPWGKAVNFDDAWSDAVRRYFIENALLWLRDFHIDGLRLDAVHTIKDFGASHFLKELKQAVEALSQTTGRHHFLIAECDLNDVRFIQPFHEGGFNLDAQWNDEFHHALHALTTGETNGYYSDFGGIGPLVKAFNNGYVYDGIYSPHRKKVFGNKTTDIPGDKFVVFAQNHDQTGNRMLGERLSTLVGFEKLKTIAATYLLSPFVPLIFMGEEYGERNPFLYFTDHSDPSLIKNVREGRKKEFKDFMGNFGPPDPQAEETFTKSRLTPSEQQNPEQKLLLNWYQELIRFRKNHRWWENNSRQHFNAEALYPEAMKVNIKDNHRHYTLIFNFGKENLMLKKEGTEKIIISSALKKWGGRFDEEEITHQNHHLIVPAESVLLFYS